MQKYSFGLIVIINGKTSLFRQTANYFLIDIKMQTLFEIKKEPEKYQTD